MDDSKKGTDIERAAEERRREIEQKERDERADSAGVFNPVEGVAPHRAGIPEREDK